MAGTHRVHDVVVPVSELPALLGRVDVDGDDGDAGLGEAAGQKTALAPGVSAVALANAVRFPRQVEGPAHIRRGKHPVGGLAKTVGPVHASRRINSGTHAVEPVAHAAPVVQSAN